MTLAETRSVCLAGRACDGQAAVGRSRRRGDPWRGLGQVARSSFILITLANAAAAPPTRQELTGICCVSAVDHSPRQAIRLPLGLGREGIGRRRVG
jgi:hypothetical protein